MHARVLAVLLVSSLSFHCATTQNGVPFGTASDVRISCRYVGSAKELDRSEVECLVENKGSKPARLAFQKVGLEDPQATLEIPQAKSQTGDDLLKATAIVLGAVIIVGMLVVLASSSNHSHVRIPSFYVPTVRDVAARDDAAFEAIEISGYEKARLVFVARHGLERPRLFVIQTADQLQDTIKVPIEVPAGWARRRSVY